ncbi:MAG: hypothetical protein JXB88_26555 [Spirochaetales bacterium]|nr:hypothetical protein [Spirochaetales bacterium]
MYFRKGVLYSILIVFFLYISGCSEKKTVEIPALIVIEKIPERVNKSLFERYILGQKDDKDNVLLKEAYTLDEESGDYIADLKAEKINEVLGIFRKINYAPLFSEPKTENLVTTIPEWTEITCITPVDNPKSVKALNASGKEQTYDWYRIRAGAKDGWILSDYLLFKSFKETEAIVIDSFRIYSIPDCKVTKIEGSCARGSTITLTGYEYQERNCGSSTKSRYSMKTYSESGWGFEPNILTDAHIGVILAETVTLYNAPDDMKQNVVENLVYRKMDFVPVLDRLENKWYKVIYYDKNSPYYIKNGDEVISSKKDDIAFASYIWEYYLPAEEIIKSVLEAQSKDPVQGIARITEKQDKLNTLNSISEEIEKYQNEYPDSIFAGIGPYSLREFIQNLVIAKDALENSLTVKDKAEDENDESDAAEGEPGVDDEFGG